MNKNIISALLFACFTIVQSNISAQDNNEARTLFGSGNPFRMENLGFFVSPSFSVSQMDQATASLFNLRGGLNYNDRFTLGAYFNTSMNQIIPDSETIPNVYMDYWTVGGFVEFTLFPKNVFHVTFPLYVGYGEVEMDYVYGGVDLGEANFFQIEPSVLLELNLHRHVRFNIGVGYRVVGQMTYRNFDQSNISGLTGHIGLKFGLFR